jgi:hypothetical protein
MIKSIKTAGITAIAAALSLFGGAVATSHAETITADGWKLTFPDSTMGTSFIGLTGVVADGSTLVIGEKDANFSAVEPLPIVFQEVGPNPASSIQIDNEAIVNSSGTSWSGFDFVLVGNATFSGSTFVLPAGYTGVSVGSTEIDYTGVQAAGDVSLWGLTGKPLVIDPSTAAGTVFFFKEIPVGGSGPLVPLPAAAWQGLTGLLGLGLLAGGKSLKAKLIA